MTDHISPPAESFQMADGKHHLHFWPWLNLDQGSGPAIGVAYPGAGLQQCYVSLVDRHAIMQMMNILLLMLASSDWEKPKTADETTNVIPFLRKT